MKNKVIEYVEELPLNSDGTTRYPWQLNGNPRIDFKFARWLFERHLCECDGYKGQGGFESNKEKVLKYIGKGGEILIDFWNLYCEKG